MCEPQMCVENREHEAHSRCGEYGSKREVRGNSGKLYREHSDHWRMERTILYPREAFLCILLNTQ